LSTTTAPPTRARPGRRQLLGLALAWSLFAIYGSFVPLQYRRIPLADAIERFRSLPWPEYAAVSSSDWATNVMLFIPLTFTWMGALVADRRWPARTAAAIALVPLAATFSIAIEFGQVWFPGRTTSLNDVAAETLGGVIGIVLWLAVGQLTITWLRQYSADRRPASQLRWLLQAYVIGFFIYAVIPLDLTMSVTDLYHKYQNGQIILIPFSYRFESFSDAAYQTLSDIALFVPIGAWVALRLKEYSPSRASFVLACALGGIIAAAIELAQLLVLSRFTDATDVVLGTIGAAIGAKLVFRRDERGDSVGGVESIFRARTALPWLALLAGYSLFLIAGFWYPFAITRNRTVIRERLDDFLSRVPFLSLYLTDTSNAIKQLLVRVLTFAPIGMIWASIASLARTAASRAILLVVGVVYATALAFGIELDEVLMPDKTADSTEVLLCVIGALAGLTVTWRVLRARREGADVSRG
jgi:glycopeptide antibiotics resistance protein